MNNQAMVYKLAGDLDRPRLSINSFFGVLNFIVYLETHFILSEESIFLCGHWASLKEASFSAVVYKS